MNDVTPCIRGCKVPGLHQIQHDRYSTCPGCKPRAAMRGTPVCKHCAEVFHQSLRDLRLIWPDLRTGVARDRKTATAAALDSLSTGRAPGRTQTTKSSVPPGPGDYWRPHVTRAMTDITDWLEFVAVALAGSPVKGLAGIDLAALKTDVALAALAVNATPILIQHPQLAEALVNQAGRLRDLAHQALSTRFVRRIPLNNPAAKCVGEVEYDDPTQPEGFRAERCNGDLVAVLQLEDSGKQSAILCSRYPIQHRVPTRSWGALADDLAALL